MFCPFVCLLPGSNLVHYTLLTGSSRHGGRDTQEVACEMVDQGLGVTGGGYEGCHRAGEGVVRLSFLVFNLGAANIDSLRL